VLPVVVVPLVDKILQHVLPVIIGIPLEVMNVLHVQMVLTYKIIYVKNHVMKDTLEIPLQILVIPVPPIVNIVSLPKKMSVLNVKLIMSLILLLESTQMELKLNVSYNVHPNTMMTMEIVENVPHLVLPVLELMFVLLVKLDITYPKIANVFLNVQLDNTEMMTESVKIVNIHVLIVTNKPTNVQLVLKVSININKPVLPHVQLIIMKISLHRLVKNVMPIVKHVSDKLEVFKVKEMNVKKITNVSTDNSVVQCLKLVFTQILL